MSDLPRGSPQSFQVSRGETLEAGIAMVSNQPGGKLSLNEQIAASLATIDQIRAELGQDSGVEPGAPSAGMVHEPTAGGQFVPGFAHRDGLPQDHPLLRAKTLKLGDSVDSLDSADASPTTPSIPASSPVNKSLSAKFQQFEHLPPDQWPDRLPDTPTPPPAKTPAESSGKKPEGVDPYMSPPAPPAPSPKAVPPQKSSKTPLPSGLSKRAPPPAEPATPPATGKSAMYSDGSYWKMKRYYAPDRGRSQASSQAVAMWKDPKQREKLHEMLKRTGSFEAVEVEIKRLSVQEQKESLEGGWHTVASLQALNWTQEMIDNSKNWAKSRGLYVEKNEVHGTEEWRIPTARKFEFNNRHQQSSEHTGRFEIQDPDGELLRDDVKENQVVQGGGSAPTAMQVTAIASAANAKTAALPVLAQNTDPFGLLPVFIDAVGKKLDKISEMQEKLDGMKVDRADKLSKELQGKLTSFQTEYDKLLQHQSDVCSVEVPSKKMKDELLATYVECRKLDVAVNTLMSRGRSMKPPAKPKSAGTRKPKKEKKEKTGKGKKDKGGAAKAKAKAKGKGKAKEEESSATASEQSDYDEEPAARRRRKAS